MRYSLFKTIFLVSFVMIIFCEQKAYSIANTQSLLATSTTNPTGTFSSGIKTLEGYSRMKGLIVINSDASGSPTAYINQAVDAQSAIDKTWHSTDTVTFSRSGILWKGEIDISIFGGFTDLTIGVFGTATFNKVNWYASIETAVSTTIITSVVGTVTASIPTVTSATHNIITVGTVSTIIIGTNTARKQIILVNEGSVNDCRIMFASVATVGSATKLYKNGGNYEPDFENAIYTGAITGITDSGTTAVSFIQY